MFPRCSLSAALSFLVLSIGESGLNTLPVRHKGAVPDGWKEYMPARRFDNGVIYYSVKSLHYVDIAYRSVRSELNR